MSKQKFLLAFAGILGMSLSTAAFGQSADAQGAAGVTGVENIQPFNHYATIPADAETGTIRLVKVKATKVPTQIKYTREEFICQNLTDPNGSLYCPYEQPQAYVDAYEVVYSFEGPVDELGLTHSTFHVYLRPEELTPVLREAIAAKKLNREESADYFHVSFIKDRIANTAANHLIVRVEPVSMPGVQASNRSAN